MIFPRVMTTTSTGKNSALKVFLDTGVFLALADEDDQYHSAATTAYADLLQAKAQLLTSEFVLSETYTLIRFKVSHPAAVDLHEVFRADRHQNSAR